MSATDQSNSLKDNPTASSVQLGRKGRPAFAFPKGRQVDLDAVNEIRTLLNIDAYQRDMLIEYLHLIQDNYGHLSAVHLAALASEMSLAQTEVYEVATFYSHFDIVREGEEAPPALTLRVCDSLTCEMMGAQDLLKDLGAKYGNDVRVVNAPCMGRCDVAPAVEVGHNHVTSATLENVVAAVDGKHVHAESPSYVNFDTYKADGGYKLLEACRSGERTAEDIIEIMSNSGLRGLGGAGFPSGRKWGIVRSYEGPRMMAVNADEGEPGTFKDKFYLDHDPHRFLEGMLIAGWAVGVDAIYVYVRDEYPAIRKVIADEIAKIKSAGLNGDTEIHLRRGAGAYICGEESAMIESIEGKRGLPRHRPPYVAEVGLFGRPTLEHNVETLYWVRDIVEKGADWFSSPMLHSYSVSGRVKEPGVKRAPINVTVRQLIDDYCGGMQEGHTFKGYLPGGASGGILPASMDNLELFFGKLEEHGCFIGSAAVVILSDKDDMKDVALNLMRFFEDESCGQCTPCRVGTEKAVALMERKTWDENFLQELAQAMTDASICGLGQAASNPLKMVLKHFRDDIVFD
jgi:NADH:ubiquinone oxidoreductase subunit F (NADH-binding)/NADH:ubiquinone oxidoreductase subunit E